MTATLDLVSSRPAAMFKYTPEKTRRTETHCVDEKWWKLTTDTIMVRNLRVVVIVVVTRGPYQVNVIKIKICPTDTTKFSSATARSSDVSAFRSCTPSFHCRIRVAKVTSIGVAYKLMNNIVSAAVGGLTPKVSALTRDVCRFSNP